MFFLLTAAVHGVPWAHTNTKGRKMQVTITMDLKWFTFSQNNSGGHFDVTDKVAHYVCVQARDAKEAWSRVSDEFDSGSASCPCCGDRWSYYADDGTDEPTVYGEPIANMRASWLRDEARLWHYDGRIERIKFPGRTP